MITALATVAGALGFLFVQIVITEIREASTERRMLHERLAAVEAETAALEASLEALTARHATLGAFVIERLGPAGPSSDWRQGPGY